MLSNIDLSTSVDRCVGVLSLEFLVCNPAYLLWVRPMSSTNVIWPFSLIMQNRTINFPHLKPIAIVCCFSFSKLLCKFIMPCLYTFFHGKPTKAALDARGHSSNILLKFLVTICVDNLSISNLLLTSSAAAAPATAARLEASTVAF